MKGVKNHNHYLVHIADDEGEGSGADDLVSLLQMLPRRPFPLKRLVATRALIFLGQGRWVLLRILKL